jgi:ATP-binding cassette subfamily B multidrug efflux pump
MFRWFETRIEAFTEAALVRPPSTLRAFYWYFVGPIWPAFALLLVVGFVGAVIEVALMAFIGSLVDLMKASSTPATFFADHGPWLLFMAFVAIIARPAVSTLHDLIKNQLIAAPFTSRIRWQTHRYVLRQSLGFFHNEFAGRIANRLMQTAPALRESVVQLIDALWYAGVQWAGALVLFATSDPRLIAPLLLWLAGYIGALFYFVPRIRQRSVDASEARSTLVGRIVDTYTNILTVKLFAHAEREDSYARAALQEQMSKWQASLRLLTSMELALYTLNGALIVTSTGLALWLWSAGHVTIGAIAVVTGLVMRLVGMSGWILWVVAGVFENIGIVQEGIETIARPYEVVDRPGAEPLRVARGEIRFERVRFLYGKKTSVIEDVTLHIRPAEKVGLVGRSGAGKSTLINLLLRFYDLEGGRILIDGQDIACVTQESLRSQIAVVTQDTSLLHRSIIDNIRYGRPDASEEMAVEAAKKAQAHDFIVGLEDIKGRKGYAAHVGERGVKLSSGQRQRIAIARALLKDAPILILDEATSALDSEVEAAIQEQLYNLMAGKTVIAIAHRLSTIAVMDRLVIMDGGRIAEQGSHDELLRRGGLYAQLWARQSGGFVAREAAE